MPAERRLAVLIPSMSGGGAERIVVNLLHGLCGRGIAVDLLLVRRSGPLLEAIPDDVRIVHLRGGRILASLPSLVSYLRTWRPDALVSHLDAMNVVAIWASRLAGTGTRTVVATHMSLSKAARGGSFKDWVTVRMMRCFYPWAEHVVGVSQGVVDELEDLAGAGRINAVVVHNPVVSEDLIERSPREASGTSMDVQRTEGPSREEQLVLSVGRLVAQKNQDLLLEAFGVLAVDDPNLQLVILGEGPERENLEEHIERLGLSHRVRLPGYVTDPSPYFVRANAFALSSNWEGLPTVLIEALAFGCPVVSTDCPWGPAEILAEGKYGRLVPMNDSRALAEAIRHVLNEPPDPDFLKDRARDFTVERAARHYLELLLPEEYSPSTRQPS